MSVSERRYLDFAVRAEGSTKRTLRARAAAFGKRSSNLGTASSPWKEEIARGAFTDPLASSEKTFALVNHDPNRILGYAPGGGLRLWQSDDGLEFSVELGDSSAARDAFDYVQSGAIDSCSFGFTVGPDGETWSNEFDSEFGKRIPVRTVHRVRRLFDVSLATYPAYPVGTSVSASTAAARSIWPDGSIPETVRLHVPGIEISEEEIRVRARVAEYLARKLRDETAADLRRP